MIKSIASNKNIRDYIRFYFSVKNPQFAVMINGKWGAGKTYFIKEEIKVWEKEFESKNESPKQKWFKRLRGNKNSNELIKLKPIYISLYGITYFTELNNKIKEQLNPLLYSKSARVIKNIALGALKTATHVNFDMNGDGKSDGKFTFDINSISLIKGDYVKTKGDKILVFDDLERCKIPIDELFGYINEFVEHYKCKVLLLCDEARLEADNKEKYNSFKEKQVGRTFTVVPESLKAINCFVEELKEQSSYVFLKGSIPLIDNVFKASDVENLRILKQVLVDFGRFTSQLNDEIINHKDYQKFLRNLIAHFTLVYLEVKSGNKATGELPGYPYGDENKQLEKALEARYLSVFHMYSILHRFSVIEYKFIGEFINNGTCNKQTLNKELSEIGFFSDVKDMAWEKLWRWELLEDEDFKRYYNEMHAGLISHKIVNPYVLLYVVLIEINLAKKGITKEDVSLLIEIFKIEFKRILSNAEHESFSLIGKHAFSKGYLGKDSDEFNEMSSFANELINKHNSQFKDGYLKELFENIDDTNVYEVNDKLKKSIPDGSTIYNRTPIFLTVNSAVFTKALLKTSNNGRYVFFDYLRTRFYPEEVYSNGKLEKYHADDKEFLIEVKNQLLENLDTLPKVKRHGVEWSIAFLDDVISKLNNIS